MIHQFCKETLYEGVAPNSPVQQELTITRTYIRFADLRLSMIMTRSSVHCDSSFSVRCIPCLLPENESF